MAPQTTYRNVRPSIIVSNLNQSLEFYKEVLGFEAVTTMGEPPTFAIIQKDEVSVTLLEHGNVYDVGDCGVNMYIDVTHVEELYRSCSDSGISISHPLTVHPWGMKDFVVVDPDGHQIALGERQSSLSPDQQN